MDDYKIESKKGEGTYSEVFTAQVRNTTKLVAIKCMKARYDSVEKITKEKEVQALKQLAGHPNIIKLLDVLYNEPEGALAYVFELMECNLYEYLKAKRKEIKEARVRDISFQILKAVEYMHRKGIFHRDIKPENILISGDIVKLADFGSCKSQLSQLPYTEYISTRWYRAPQCILTDGYYDYKMDIWGVGCVIFQLMSKFALFPGKDEIDQIHKIHNILGTPPKQLLDKFSKHSKHIEVNFPQKKGVGIEKLVPEASEEFIDLVYKLLTYDPQQRITAQQALKHSCFRGMEEIYEQRFNAPAKKKPRSDSQQHLLPKLPSRYQSLQKNKPIHFLNQSDIYGAKDRRRM